MTGLDKWIKPEETKSKSIKKKDDKEPRKTSDIKPKGKESENELLKITKFILLCSNAKCKYKKTIVKKVLKEKDKICPRCKNEMKVK